MAKDKKLFSDAQPALDNDRDLLTADEIAALQAEVELEAADELREQAKKTVKAKLRAEARLKKGLDEPQEEVTIDLAPYADRLLIDNVAYLQGVTYTVRASLAAVLREQSQRTWGHQSEIDGKSENFYRKARGTRVLPNGGVINTSQILRA
jgi:hypothetical protein